jgi:hypothetical protein
MIMHVALQLLLDSPNLQRIVSPNARLSALALDSRITKRTAPAKFAQR